MDSQMLFGCSGFVVTSFVVYGLAIWPFLVWLRVDELGTLLLASAAGLPVAFILGVFAARKFEIAGAAGFIGGMVAASIFLHLRFKQVFLEAAARQIEEPHYPAWIQWFAPIAVVVASLLIAAMTLLLWRPIQPNPNLP